jgi:signal peptidase I
MNTFFIKLSTLLAVVVGLIALFVLGSILPTERTYTLRVVQSGSMEPAIPTGSVVATIPRSEYRVGDAVTFTGIRAQEASVTHRIIGIEENQGQTLFVTKGDTNDHEDLRRVTEEEIMGSVFLVVPYVGYLSAFAQTRAGIILLIFAPLIIVVFSEMLSLIRHVGESKQVKHKKYEKTIT